MCGSNFVGTHWGHIQLFLVAPCIPSCASASLCFLSVPFSAPAFTAVTRVQIPSGTPKAFSNIPKNVFGSKWSTLKLVHKGEVALHYISVVALLAHPTFSGVTVSELPRINMSFAQLAVLVAPPARNSSRLGFRRQSLIGGRIVPTLTSPSLHWFYFRPDSYLASFDD